MIITRPLSLDGDNSFLDMTVSSMFKAGLALFKDVKPGSDLTTFQIPPQLNMPKSNLQFYGEPIYSFKDNLLEKCNNGESPMERLIAVIAWTISHRRPWVFASGAPYNSILGETHHVSHGTLNVLLEQISHHPPVLGLHATDEKENIEFLMCQRPLPKYYGTSVVLQLLGKRQLKLLNYGETYVMNSPNVTFKFFPAFKVEMRGTQKIQCHETGFEVELSYGNRSILGNSRSIKGKIFASASLSKPIFEIDGHWDKVVMLKDLNNDKVRVIYDAKEVISRLQTPIVKDPEEVWSSESVSVWRELTHGIIEKDWKKVGETKKSIEQKQRDLARERKESGETWVPKHFATSYSPENGWECSPLQKLVPPAPIVVPSNDGSLLN